MVRELLKDRELSYALQFASFEKGTDWMAEIQRNFEKPEVVELFNTAKNPHCWRKDKLIIKGASKSREGSVMIFGADQGLAGYHPKRIIFDDLHDDKNSQTKDQVAKIVKVFSRSITEIATKDTKCIMVATIWDKEDSACKVINEIEGIADWEELLAKKYHQGTYWDIYIRQAIEDNAEGEKIILKSPTNTFKTWEKAKLFFPEELDVELLNQKYTQAPSDYDFVCQYFNNPKVIQNLEFKEEWIKVSQELEEKIKKDPVIIKYLLVDPAYTVNKKSDSTAFIVCGFTSKNQLRVLLAHKEKLDSKEVVEMVFSLQKQWRPRIVGIEANASQKLLSAWIRDKQRETGQVFRITEIKTGPKKAKEDRIRELIPYFKEGRIAIPVEFEDIFEELANFPRGSHDDLIDALSFIEMVRRPLFLGNQLPDKDKAPKVLFKETGY